MLVKRGDMNYSTADDTVLVNSARDGDVDAFEALVTRHQRAVYAHALRFFGDPTSAEDATQEVFIKVYRSLDGFDERSRFSTWLYRVTRNACLDSVRAGKRVPVPVDPLDVLSAAPGDLSDQVAVSTTLEAGMRALAPEDRDALSAVALFGLSYAEAAESLGVPEGTVKSRVFRARRSLAAMIVPSKGGA